MKLTAERLRELLHYNPDTGIFTRKVKIANQHVGDVAGSSFKYCNISIDKEYHGAHRLAFLYMTGEWPNGEVDHINGNRLDNRWLNLRDATKSENQHNRPAQKNNKSGYKGVYWNAFAKKWSARLCVNRTLYHLGYFNSVLEAHLAYEQAVSSLVKNRERAA